MGGLETRGLGTILGTRTNFGPCGPVLVHLFYNLETVAMLTHALEGVLGATAKVKVLRALLPLTSPVSGREAKDLAGIRSQSGAQQALVALSQLGVLHEERIRGARLYRVNRAHH